jgi:16S rRNA (cytosine967-C5)-methyltransferase
LIVVARVSPARSAAFDVLMAVEGELGNSDELLRDEAVNALSGADRNLATALVLGVLRWQIALDEQIRKFLKRPGARLDAEVRIALRMGAFQLGFLDRVPAHAAIDDSVELVKRAGHRFAAGMVNAILRKMAASRESAKPFNAESTSLAEFAMAWAHPAWMVERWARFYGLEATRGICAHGQRQPVTAVRLADAAVEAELAREGVELGPGELLSGARRVLAGNVMGTAALRAGRVRLQDEGSQLIGEIAAFVGELGGRKAEKFLDCCAAPGGKTLILAERNPEARIVACEASPRRLTMLRERLAGCGERVECRLADAAALNVDAEFDGSLVDAPCSGTGTLGRNPEIRHRLRPEDLPRQAERQRAIVRAALHAVRPGGLVVYSTCSLEPEENEQVVSAALAQSANARQLSLSPHIGALFSKGVLIAAGADRLRDCVTPEGSLRLLPGAIETDGFFVALFERCA